MSILGDRIRGASVADLFAGSGALGLEALSRGAAHVTFGERSHRVVRVLEKNIFALGAGSEATVIRGDAMRHTRNRRNPPYDLALADPPYDHGYAFRLLAGYEATPFARELWIEHDVREALPPGVEFEQRRYGDTALTRVTETGGGSR
jgi:16S rRNA (guanine966-N2)-methyltransferase